MIGRVEGFTAYCPGNSIHVWLLLTTDSTCSGVPFHSPLAQNTDGGPSCGNGRGLVPGRRAPPARQLERLERLGGVRRPRADEAALRNERRRRRRAAAAAAADETPQATTETDAGGRRSSGEGAVEGRREAPEEHPRHGRQRDARRRRAQEIARRDDLEANRAPDAVLAGFAAKRPAADAVMGQLDDVQFDDAYECACCREVLELPVKLPRRSPILSRVSPWWTRATRPADVVCPFCRAPFYDGAKCRVAAAKRRRNRNAVTGRATRRDAAAGRFKRSPPDPAARRPPLRAAFKIGPRALPGARLLYSEKTPLSSSPAASSPLEDALLRRFRTSRRSGGRRRPEPVPGVDARAAAAAAALAAAGSDSGAGGGRHPTTPEAPRPARGAPRPRRRPRDRPPLAAGGRRNAAARARRNVRRAPRRRRRCRSRVSPRASDAGSRARRRGLRGFESPPRPRGGRRPRASPTSSRRSARRRVLGPAWRDEEFTLLPRALLARNHEHIVELLLREPPEAAPRPRAGTAARRCRSFIILLLLRLHDDPPLPLLLLLRNSLGLALVQRPPQSFRCMRVVLLVRVVASRRTRRRGAASRPSARPTA